MKSTIPLLICLVMWLNCANAPAGETTSTLQQTVNQIAADLSIKNGQFGFYAVDVASRKALANYHDWEAMIPASTMKAITTATALGLLKADYKYKTELQYDGKIEAGVLKGNLYLKGYGDPTFGSEEFDKTPGFKAVLTTLAQQVQKAGIKSIEGYVVADGSHYNAFPTPATWQLSDMGNYYGAGVFGLNIRENQYVLTLEQSASVGDAVGIKSYSPEVPGLKLSSQLTAASKGSGDNAYIYLAPYENSGVVKGTIPAGSGDFRIKGSIPDVEQFAAHHLHKTLVDAGVKVSKGHLPWREAKTKAARQVIYTHYSPRLIDIIDRTNKESINLYAEALLRSIGTASGTGHSTEDGVEALKTFWQGRGLEPKGIFIEDGSGLSPRNGMSAKYMTEVLLKVAAKPEHFPGFMETLSVAGVSGTLKNMCKGTIAEGKVFAKSGSISRVRAYCGYVNSKSGKKIAFAMMANNFDCTSSEAKQKLEKLMVALAEQ